MRPFLTLPLCLAAAAATSACGGDPARVEIAARPVSREAVRTESLSSVESARRTILVRQTIRVPDACRALAGDLLHTGGTLTLRVHAEPDGRTCRREEAYMAYSAHIRGLPPGRYELRVVHAPAERRAPRQVVLKHPVVVLERAVQVP